MKITQEDLDKLEKAREEFQKIYEEIKPFIHKRKIKEYKTVGLWQPSDYSSE